MPLEDEDRGRLRDMLSYARDALSLLAGRDYTAVEQDMALRYSLVRCVEVIGEAGHKVSDDTRRRLTSIPWHLMWGMRNRLIHDYGSVNYEIIYGVVSTNLPQLVLAIQALGSEIDEHEA
jgi:uncharacterized protein with HEPN domain